MLFPTKKLQFTNEISRGFLKLASFRKLVSPKRLAVVVFSLVIASTTLTPATAVPTLPMLIEDINEGVDSSLPSGFTELNDKLYFRATDDEHGQELWVYDGVSSSLLQDIVVGPDWSFPSDFTVFNNKLYFVATDPIRGRELWVYDDTADVSDENPSLLIDITGGFIIGETDNGFPRFLTVFNNKLYFSTAKSEIYVYDDTADVSTTNPGELINFGQSQVYVQGLTVFNNKLYFDAQTIDGQNMYVYDDTADVSFDIEVPPLNPVMIRDLDDDGYSAFGLPNEFTVYNNKLFLRADVGQQDDFRMWVYNGPEAEQHFTEIGLPANEGGQNPNPDKFTVLSGLLYFVAYNGACHALWVFDDNVDVSSTNPKQVNSFCVNGDFQYGNFSTELAVFDDELYFQGYDSAASTEVQLWAYDGSSGTEYPLNEGGTLFHSQLESTSLGLFFSANTDETGFELWGFGHSVDGSDVAPSASPTPTPATQSPYSGPLPGNYSDRTPSIGDEVTISGPRLDQVTSCTIDGVEVEISSQSSTGLTIVIPEGLEPGLKDLVMVGTFGKITSQGAFTVEAGPAKSPVVAEKTNAGSFNGYVAVYAKGHKGKTLSWKIAGKWFKTTITSDFQVFQRKTEAVGLDVEVHLYIDGEKQSTMTVRTS
jgi:ELWxxDGT repeat protein